MSTRNASDLDATSRSDLIARAEALGVDKANVLTRAELVDEIVKRAVTDPIERRLARGLLGVARDLVARVVERGLHLPDAAALIRGLQQVTLTPVTPPIATVTLAEIYAGQGHRNRSLAVLDEVLAKEPDHAAARALREKVAALTVEAVAAETPSQPPPQHDRDRDRDHNEADQVVLLPIDATSVLAYWEIRQTALDEARSRAPEGVLVLRIVAVTSSWDGPTAETRDIDATRALDECWVCDLPSGAVLRAAVGWRSEGGFDPLAVALDVASCEEVEGVVTTEADPSSGSHATAVDEPAALQHAGALGRARRRVAQSKPAEARGSSSWRALAFAPREARYDAPALAGG